MDGAGIKEQWLKQVKERQGFELVAGATHIGFARARSRIGHWMTRLLKRTCICLGTFLVATGQVLAADSPNRASSVEKLGLAMNLFSQEAKSRTELFESVAKGHGFVVLTGRFGGEFNNDQLAVKQQDDRTLLLLGLKRTGALGDLQLDQFSMGPFMQFSGDWLTAVVQVLKIDRTQYVTAFRIELARKLKKLDLVVLLIDHTTQEVKFLGVETPD